MMHIIAVCTRLSGFLRHPPSLPPCTVPGAVICITRSRGEGITGRSNGLLQGLFADCRHPRQSYENRYNFRAEGCFSLSLGGRGQGEGETSRVGDYCRRTRTSNGRAAGLFLDGVMGCSACGIWRPPLPNPCMLIVLGRIACQ